MKLEVRSNRFGRGCYAISDILVGEIIGKFSGPFLTYTDSKRLGEKEAFALQVGVQQYIYPDSPFCYINHSCEPNLGVEPSLNLVALQPILKGHEVFFDYSTTMDEDDWTMACSCETKYCRKIIKDFKYLPAELQKAYIDKNVVQQFILSHSVSAMSVLGSKSA